MTIKDKATLKAQSAATFPSATGNILASDHRVYNVDDIDSAMNLAETTTQTVSGDIDMSGNSILNDPRLDQVSKNVYVGWTVAPIPTVNAGDNHLFDLSAGVGVFVDFSDPENVVSTILNYAGATGIAGTLLGSAAIRQTYITIAEPNTIVQRGVAPNEQEAETELFVGNMTHINDLGTNDVFDDATSTPFTNYSLARTFREFLRIFGGINVSGLVYTGVSGTLSMQHTSGVGLAMGRNYELDVSFPDTPRALSQNPVPVIVQKYEDLAGELLTAPVNAFVDVTQYRDPSAGALVTLPNNNWQIKRIFFFYNSNTTIMYYGNAAYANLESALSGVATEGFTEHNDTFEAVFRGYLLVQKGATDLTDDAESEFRTSGGFRPSGSAQGLSTSVTLQDAYDLGEEILTNPTNGPMDIRVGSGSDGDPILRGLNNAATVTFSVDGMGDIAGNTLVVEELNAQDTTNDTFQSFQVKNTVGAVTIHGKGNGDLTAVQFFGDISNTTGAPASSITQFFSQRRNSTQSLAIALPVVVIPNIANTTARGTVLNTATGLTTITSTTEGAYHINFAADISINNSVTNAIFLVVLRVNGTDRIRQNFIQPFTVGVFPVSISGYFDLVDTDTVDITIRNGSDQIASIQNSGFLYNVVRLSA